MTTRIAFLRAINVGGHTVTMAELHRLFEVLGFERVETFIASGNVIFSSEARDVPALNFRIEAHLRASLGYDVKTFLRTGSELASIAEFKPFGDSQLESARALNIGFLDEPLTAASRRLLAQMKSEFDDFRVHGRELYWLCRRKQSESDFSNARFERVLGLSATFRNVNTVVKLAAKYAP